MRTIYNDTREGIDDDVVAAATGQTLMLNWDRKLRWQISSELDLKVGKIGKRLVYIIILVASVGGRKRFNARQVGNNSHPNML